VVGRTPAPDTAPLSPEQAYLATDLPAVITDPQARAAAQRAGATARGQDRHHQRTGRRLVHRILAEVIGRVGRRREPLLRLGRRARAAPDLIEYMHAALDLRPVRDFGAGGDRVRAHRRKTGLLADASSTNSVFQAYPAGSEPTESLRAAEDTAEGQRLLRMDAF
jgi:hypothetical protein